MRLSGLKLILYDSAYMDMPPANPNVPRPATNAYLEPDTPAARDPLNGHGCQRGGLIGGLRCSDRATSRTQHYTPSTRLEGIGSARACLHGTAHGQQRV
eukprot:902298-Prymnesium_polylepis.1